MGRRLQLPCKRCKSSRYSCIKPHTGRLGSSASGKLENEKLPGPEFNDTHASQSPVKAGEIGL